MGCIPHAARASGVFANPSPDAATKPYRLLSVILALMMCAACGSSSPPKQIPNIPFGDGPPVLLFVGTGTSANDVAALESVLATLKIKYATADSVTMNAMTEVGLMDHHLLIVPGGNSIEIGQGLTPNVSAMIQDAVQRNGLHYLGVCAGAFYGGASIYNGVDLTYGVGFNFFAEENLGVHKAAVNITFPDNTMLDAYWQDGPELSGWGDVVAKYPDGTPAITEGQSGNGFVMFTGVHLEAPDSWRQGLSFTTPTSTDIAYSGSVIQAALSGTALPHF